MIGPYNLKEEWRFRCPRLPALISPLIDYVPRRIALLCLVVCIARRYQIVSSFVPGGCCVTLQMLIRAGVLSWIKPGERFRSSLGSVVTQIKVVKLLKSPLWHIFLLCFEKHDLLQSLRLQSGPSAFKQNNAKTKRESLKEGLCDNSPLVGPDQECNINFITNGWSRFATRCGWAQSLLLGLPKQHLITLRLLWISSFPCNVRTWLWNPSNG